MSRTNRKPANRRRIPAYSWLGSSAVTLGMGAAMIGGAAAAFADTGADSTGGTTASQNAESAGSAAAQSDPTGPRKKATRPSRGPAVSAADAGGSSAPALGRKSRVPTNPAIPDIPDVAPAAAVNPEAATSEPAPAESNIPLPAAAVATAPTDPAPALAPKRANRAARTATAPVPTQAAVDPAPVVEDSPAETAPAAAVPGPAADPAPEMTSWLPATPIVPGAHVALALQEIADAQGIITAQTWGSGNPFAGVVAIVPQVFLAGAALSLQAWGATNPAAQGFVAGTAGIPLIHQAAQITLLSTMLLPGMAEVSMGVADLVLPLVNLFGADGILGTGANTAGPGPVAIPSALMPGELSNGVLLYQNVFFGLGGVMVLGPNPLPTRVSVPGAPDAFVTVSVNDGPKTDAGAIIDSGGVYGTLNTANDTTGTPVGSNLPAGTKISVYTADGSTLLYTYTTQSGVRGTPVIATGLFNTGNAPFAQGPIYLNYGFDEPYGIGSTDFSIW